MTAPTEKGEPGPPVSDLAGFTDVTLVGRGAQGSVYRATKTSIGKVVALKAFPLGPGAVLHERALRSEMAALVALSHHPGVVGVHDLHLHGAWAWLEMDYCAGGSSVVWATDLARAHDWEPRAAVATLLKLGGQVAQALAFAHRLGWVHGDVKPGNILLDHLGTARVCDFGLARLASVGLVPQPGYRAPGTPRYQPPEVLREGAVPTAAGDVFALAETLRDLRRLLGGDGLAAPERVLDPDVTDTEALGTSPTEILADLEVLLAHMSAADSARRPRASEVTDRLTALGTRLASDESALSGAASPTDPPTLPGPPSPTLPTTRPRRRRAVQAVVAAGAALALLGVAGGTAWLLWPDPPSSSAGAVTYAWPAGLITPQLIDGSCVFTVFYGNLSSVAFAKVRFYSGDCGGTTLAVLGRGDDGVTRSWGDTWASSGEDECGQYIETQADSGAVKSTAVGQTVRFRETGVTYTFTAGEGMSPAVHRTC